MTPTGENMTGAELIREWRRLALRRIHHSVQLTHSLGLSPARLEYFRTNEPRYIIGVDEVGCGPLAGPVTVCAFIAKAGWALGGVKDSKKLSREEQAVLVPDIISTGMGHHISELPNTTIDKIGMSQSLQLLYEECLEQLRETFPTEFAEALIVIDGKLWARHIDHISLPKGDDIVPHVSAASILAKYQRDTWMIEVADKIYPEYSFDKHKGYGTQRHRSMIARHGICPLHRTTFLKNANAWRE